MRKWLIFGQIELWNSGTGGEAVAERWPEMAVSQPQSRAAAAWTRFARLEHQEVVHWLTPMATVLALQGSFEHGFPEQVEFGVRVSGLRK